MAGSQEFDDYIQELQRRAREFSKEAEGRSRIAIVAMQQRKKEQEDFVRFLESELDDEKRRSLRLERELLNETQLRAAAEKQLMRAERETVELEDKLAELEKKNEPKRTGSSKRTDEGGKRTRSGGKVSDGVQRVDGSPAPKRKSNAKPADKRSDAGADGSKPNAGSSRKRGNVK